MTESWKPIEGYEGIYEVSDQGRVRNVKRGGRILSLASVAHGYLAAGLYKEGKKRMHLVHRLVAQAFIPNPENKPQVNHKDMDKSHNFVSNLEWMTAEENLEHAAIHKPPATRKNPWARCTPEQRPNYTATLWRSRVKEIREAKGLTQEELAELCCVRIDTLQKLESNGWYFRSVGLTAAYKLAWGLGVNIEGLFDCDVEEVIRREKAWHHKI